MFPVRFRLAAVALFALIAACSEGSTGPKPHASAGKTDKASPKLMLAVQDGGATREVREEIYDLAGSVVMLPCGEHGATEEVAIEGKIFSKVQWISDAAGGLHITSSWMPIGIRGIGLESGAEYRISERENSVHNGTPMSATNAYRYTLNWQAQELGTRGTWTIESKVIVNANGEYVVERGEVSASCRD
jgi:hypothetical protein